MCLEVLEIQDRLCGLPYDIQQRIVLLCVCVFCVFYTLSVRLTQVKPHTMKNHHGKPKLKEPMQIVQTMAKYMGRSEDTVSAAQADRHLHLDTKQTQKCYTLGCCIRFCTEWQIFSPRVWQISAASFYGVYNISGAGCRI